MKHLFYTAFVAFACLFALQSCSDDVRSRKLEKDGKQIGYIKLNLADNIYNKYNRNVKKFNNAIEGLQTYDDDMFIHQESNQIKNKDGKLLCIFGTTNHFERGDYWYLDMTNINYSNTDDAPAEGDAVIFHAVVKKQDDFDKQMAEPRIFVFYRLSKGSDWHGEISKKSENYYGGYNIEYVDKSFPKYAKKCFEEYKKWWNDYMKEIPDYRGSKIE